MKVDGSLGGLQLLDLTQYGGSRHHQKVFSVGHDPNGYNQPSFINPMASFSSSGHNADENGKEQDEDVEEKAFTLKLLKPHVGDSRPASPVGLHKSAVYGGDVEADKPVELTLTMASLCYTHSPSFLRDLSLCLSDFKDYMSHVGSKVRHAATEVALGLVHTRSEMLHTSLYDSNASLEGGIHRMRTISIDEQDDVDELDDNADKPLNIKLDIVLQIPVVILPVRPQSADVLVAHLGHISIRNSPCHPVLPMFTDKLPCDNVCPDRLYLEIRDMSMYSMNLTKQKALHMEAKKGCSLNTSVFSTPQPGGYVQTSYGTPILHDTVLELTIEKIDVDDSKVEMDLGLEHTQPDSQSVLQVSGKIVTPLRVVLTKVVYEQILNTLDNLTPADDDDTYTFIPGQSSSIPTGLSNISEETAQPSISAVKVDNMSTAGSFSSISIDSKQADTPLIINADFAMPELDILMMGELGEGEQGLVDICLQDFKINFVKTDSLSKSFDVCVGSLVIEDLLENPHSSHRYLMESSSPKNTGSPVDVNPHSYLSSSCPTSMIDIPQPRMPPSLPTSFQNENVFDIHKQLSQATTSKQKAHRSQSER